MSCSDLMKWTKKVDLFEYDILFIPVHNVNHWSLAAVWSKPNEHAITFFDSYGQMNLGCLENLKDFMEKENLRRKKSISFQWTLDCVPNIPQQFNKSDENLLSESKKRLGNESRHPELDNSVLQWFKEMLNPTSKCKPLSLSGTHIQARAVHEANLRGILNFFSVKRVV